MADKEGIELAGLIIKAIARRIPDEEFGILFSGGIDSTLIAWVCKQLGIKPKCYTAAFQEKGFTTAEDLTWAKKAAKKLGFSLKVRTFGLAEVDAYAKRVVSIIKEPNVVKTGVGIVVQAAMELAKKDSIRTVFSGLGSEEIFAGYERHRKAKDINRECARGLKEIYKRDISRDNAIAEHNKMRIEMPFLDEALVKYALKIPGKYKISNGVEKAILREVAQNLGIPEELCLRRKKAAQYGSKVDRALEKLAKKGGFTKTEYLEQFCRPKLAALVSSGKDGLYAAWLMKKQGYEIGCFVTIESKNQDSFMWHTPNVKMAKLQAEAAGVPIITAKTKGEKEKELDALRKALKQAKYSVQGVVTGALWSNYQRERVERICRELGLKVFSPLWHKEQEKHLRELLCEGFEAIITAIAAEGLDAKWLGRRIDTQAISELKQLHEKNKLNIAGEGGEYESLVLDCPMFAKRINIVQAEKTMSGKQEGRYVISRAMLGARTNYGKGQ